MNPIGNYRIWSGHAGDGSAYRELLDRGIKAVVQLAMEEPLVQPPRELIFCRYPLVDGFGNDPILLRLAIETVASLMEKEVPTLVSCGAGMSRSPAIIAAALATIRGAELGDCLKIVAEHHPADLTPGFVADVERVLNRS